MLIRSIRLGELDVPEDAIIDFPNGLPGFPDEKAFAFLPYKEESPFSLLQSVTEPALTFIVVDPFFFFKDYEFTLSDEITSELNLDDQKLPQVVNIVRVPDKLAEMTTNLLAPVVINVQDRKGMQIVLEKTSYSTRHRLFPNGLPNQSEREGK